MFQSLRRQGGVAAAALFVSVVTLAARPARAEPVSLFDGSSLAGWSGKPELWSVKDGAIVGSTHPDGIRSNTFLVSDGEYENFVLRLKFKFTGGNSGIQFRSALVGDPSEFVIGGYQADLGDGWHGSIYDE